MIGQKLFIELVGVGAIGHKDNKDRKRIFVTDCSVLSAPGGKLERWEK